MKECTVCFTCFPDNLEYCPSDGVRLKFSLRGDLVLDARYKLERRLGRGGMGIVYKASHVLLRSTHAIKVILPDLVGEDQMLVTRFRQEAVVAASIRHKNIVLVTDFGVVDGTMPFLVMEFLAGRSLWQIICERGRLSTKASLEIMEAIVAGVAAAHRRGIVHRDLKPLNIFVQDGMPITEGLKILDFGLAKIKSTDLFGSLIQAKTTSAMGSPLYMAPEQWSEGEPDARADIYSIGIILYQMLAGDTPFTGTSLPKVMKGHLMTVPPSFASLGVKVSRPVEEVVRHALEKDPRNRPSSVDELLAELREAISKESPDQSPMLMTLRNDQFEVDTRPLLSRETDEFDPVARAPLSLDDEVLLETQRKIEDEADRLMRELEDAQRRAEEARGRVEEAARKRAEKEAERKRAEAEAARKRAEEEEARKVAEEEERKRVAAEQARKSSQEEEARRLAEEEVRRQAEEQLARKLAEEEANQLSREVEEARRRADEARMRAEEEAQGRAKEEAARRIAEERAERLAREVEEAQQRAEEAHKRAEEQERKRAEKEAERQLAEEQAGRKLAEDEAQRTAEDKAARQHAQEEAERLAREFKDAERRVEEARNRAEEEAQLRAEAEAARKRAEEEASRLTLEVEVAQRRAEEVRQLAEEEARRRAEEEVQRRAAEETARKRAEEEAIRLAREVEVAQRRAEEVRQLAEDEARIRAQEEAQRRAAEETARKHAEEEARIRAQEETERRAAEEIARKRAEEEAIRLAREIEVAQRRAEEVRQLAEAEARKRAQEELKRRAAEETARKRAEEEARIRAQEEAQRRAAEETARKRAEEEAIRLAREVEEAKKREEIRKLAEEEAREAAKELERKLKDQRKGLETFSAQGNASEVTVAGNAAQPFPRDKNGPALGPRQTITGSGQLVASRSQRQTIKWALSVIVFMLLVLGGYTGFRLLQSTQTQPWHPDMVSIPGGTFTIGSDNGGPQEAPAHPVTVSAFSIDRTQITNAEYADFVREANYSPPSHWSGNIPPVGQEKYQIVNVSFDDAQAFATWRSKRDGVTYRLPTEEEWEYAAKGVGSLPKGASAWGVLDMVGNVLEWTSSRASIYPGNKEMMIDDDKKEWPVVRGSSYKARSEQEMAVTMRQWVSPSNKDPRLGFRLVRPVP